MLNQKYFNVGYRFWVLDFQIFSTFNFLKATFEQSKIKVLYINIKLCLDGLLQLLQELQ